jgi:tripartite motif-containing protein 71
MFRKTVTLLIFAALIHVMFLALMSDAINSPIQAQQNGYSFVKKWGSEGVGFGKFAQPLAIAIDSNNNIYVTDTTSVSNQIQKFTNNGTFITSRDIQGRNGPFTNAGIGSSDDIYITGGGNPDTAVQKFTNNGTSLGSWGSAGLEDGQFVSPGWITVDSNGNVYVGDFGENYRIQKFDGNGTFISKWGTPGSSDGQFKEPTGVAIDSLGNVYVVDRGNSRIQVFAPQ